MMSDGYHQPYLCYWLVYELYKALTSVSGMAFQKPNSKSPLSLLRTFDVAAKHSNFTKAAQELSLSQPAVSQQVRLLEQTMGQQLFHRAGPVVRLTDYGRRLAASVADLMAHVDYVMGRFEARSSDNFLEVRAISTFATRWLLPRLPAFLDAHPEVELNLTTSYWATEPQATGAPVHIDSGPVPEGAELVVGPQKMLAVARPDVAARFASPTDLADATLLEVVGADGWRYFLSRFDTALEPWPRTHTSMTYLHTIELARMGIGVALALEITVEDLIDNGDLALVAGMAQPSREHYYLVAPPEQTLNTAATAFLDWLRSFRR